MSENLQEDVDRILYESVVSPEMRAELCDLAVDAEALLPAVDAIARRCYQAQIRYRQELLERGLLHIDDIYFTIGPDTGWERLETALMALSDVCQIGAGNPAKHSAPPAWVDPDRYPAG